MIQTPPLPLRACFSVPCLCTQCISVLNRCSYGPTTGIPVFAPLHLGREVGHRAGTQLAQLKWRGRGSKLGSLARGLAPGSLCGRIMLGCPCGGDGRWDRYLLSPQMLRSGVRCVENSQMSTPGGTGRKPVAKLLRKWLEHKLNNWLPPKRVLPPTVPSLSLFSFPHS